MRLTTHKFNVLNVMKIWESKTLGKPGLLRDYFTFTLHTNPDIGPYLEPDETCTSLFLLCELYLNTTFNFTSASPKLKAQVFCDVMSCPLVFNDV